jgi:DNA mismatch repair protein MutS2
VHIAHLGLRGEIVAIDGDTAVVRAGAITVKVPRQAVRVSADQVASGRAGSRVATRGAPGDAQAAARAGAAFGGHSVGGGGGVNRPDKDDVAAELRLIGKTTDEARDLLEKYLDDAFLVGLPSVRIIHGRGTGALRRAVEELLSAHPLVLEHRPGAPAEGGTGATVAVLGQG